MHKLLLTITFVSVFVTSLGFLAPSTAPANETSRSLWESTCMIRKDKFDFVLPGAMRRSDIDMWIILDRGRGTEPMARDFGIDTVNGQGTYVFFDPGEGRIERIQLGPETDMAEDCGAYDMFGRSRQLKAIVEERDPKKIGLNYLAVPNTREGIHVANGLSHTDYQYLEDLLGEKYATRFTSAQHLIADFHGERVAGEIIEFSKLGQITRRGIERALSNEVITPGKTSLKEVSMWLEEYREANGLQRAWYPGVGIRRSGGARPQHGVDSVIQRGDILSSDWGGIRNNFGTDIKRFAYVLREGEEVPPPDVVAAFEVAKDIADIIRHNVRSGRTGREQLDDLKQVIRDAGYNYTERERPSDGPGIDVNVGMHAAGNIGHDVAAGLFEIFPERTKYVVRPNNIISLEYRIFMPSERWGEKIGVNIEENALITERGIEWLYPPQEKVLVIR